MYTYRIVLDCFSAIPDYGRSPSVAEPCRVVTYSQGHTRAEALRRLGSIAVSSAGAASNGIEPWPGTNNMPVGTGRAATYQEWTVVTMRSVPKPGTSRVIAQ